LALVMVPAVAFAASPFDGTWKTLPESMKVTGKADQWQVLDGVYTCASCVPEVKVKADGKDHPVIGHEYYDTVAVVVVSPSAIHVVQKLKGKRTGSVELTASIDGKTLTGKFQDFTGTQVDMGTFTETRRAAGPPGSHAVSGFWQQERLSDTNDVLRTFAYEMTNDQFSMHWNGLSYNAKFDGKEYPVQSDPGGTMVSVKQLDNRTVEETDHRQGKVTDEIRLAAAKDGKTIAITDNDVIHQQITTFTLEKQE
jgi:hypothetical protein